MDVQHKNRLATRRRPCETDRDSERARFSPPGLASASSPHVPASEKREAAMDNGDNDPASDRPQDGASDPSVGAISNSSLPAPTIESGLESALPSLYFPLEASFSPPSYRQQISLSSSVQPTATAWERMQKLIVQLTKAIHANPDLNTVFQLTLEGIAEALLVDRASIVLLKYADPLHKSLSLQQLPKVKANIACQWQDGAFSPVSVAPEGEAGAELSFWGADCSLCQSVLRAAPQPVAIAALNSTRLFDPETVASAFKLQEFSALLAVPLFSSNSATPAQGIVLGFLLLQQRQPRLWQAADLELAELVSAQVSNSTIQAQTLKQIQSLVDERTAQLQRSLEVQAKLYEQTRRQIDQLRHLNQVKDEFLNGVHHELRTPLTKMKVAISLLQQVDVSPDRRKVYLNILDQQCNQEINLIEDLLALQKLESNQTPLLCQPIDLKSLMQQLAQAFEERWADKGLTMLAQFPKRSLKLQSDPDSLKRVLEELLTNAGKYSHPNTTVVLDASHQVDRQQVDRIVLTLANVGAGITEAELPHIFDKFRRGAEATQQAIPGTGLGLALVKSLVQHLEGAITVSSTKIDDPANLEAWQTCFTLTLPQIQAISKG